MNTQFNKRLYTVGEFYHFMHDLMRSFKYERRAEKNGILEKDFKERIMLAVTEVNGCEICSYAHTEMALKQGMSQEEINSMLSGETEHIPEEQSIAIFFAQHYADSHGKPTKSAWERVVKTYGKEKSLAILASIRAIMVGNTYGIAQGALSSRFKGEKVEKSNLGYELLMTVSILPFIPIALVHSLISNITKKPLLVFSN